MPRRSTRGKAAPAVAEPLPKKRKAPEPELVSEEEVEDEDADYEEDGGSDDAGEGGEEESGEEGEGEEEDDNGLTPMERRRQENIRRNRAVMEKEGLLDAKAAIDKSRAADKARKIAARVAASERRRLEAKERGPARRSGRLAGVEAPHVEGELGAPAAAGRETANLESWSPPSRLGTEPIALAGGAQLRAALAAASLAAAEAEPIVLGPATAARVATIKALKMTDVAKVTKERAYSLCWHPGEKLLLAVGDKVGNVGLWTVDAGDVAEEVASFRPHVQAVPRLQYAPDNAGRMYSTSYDGTVRVLDLARGEFLHVFSDDDEREGHLTYSDLGAPSGACANLMLFSDSDGGVGALDLRAGSGEGVSVAWRHQLHSKKVNTVHVLPTSGNLIITASLDRSAKIWDVRNMGSGSRNGKGKAPAPLASMPHKLSVNSAHFNRTGDWIATVCQDNFLHMYKDPAALSGADVEPHHSIAHNNQTGRWISKFQVSWDPKSDDLFVVGCLQKPPHRVQVFSAGNRRPVAELTADEMQSIQSVNAFHPSLDIIAGVNSSGRVHVFR